MRKRKGFGITEVLICMLLASIILKCTSAGYLLLSKTAVSLRNTAENCSEINAVMYSLMTDIKSAEKIAASENKLVITLDDKIEVYEYENGRIYKNGAGLLKAQSCAFAVSGDLVRTEIKLQNGKEIRIKIRREQIE